MAISSEMRRRIESCTRQLCEEVGEVDASEGDCWLDVVENQALEISDAIHAELVARQAEQRLPAEKPSSCPECGQAGCYRGERQRELVTRRGPTTIAEPEYYCPGCRRAFFPADGRVGS